MKTAKEKRTHINMFNLMEKNDNMEMGMEIVRSVRNPASNPIFLIYFT